MEGREVTTHKGEDFTLTEEEEKFVRALERLSKMKMGRLELMASGTISVRIDGMWHENNIDGYIKGTIYCEGGDGGD